MNLAEKFAKFSAESKEDQPIGINGKVLLVDGLNTYLRAFAATPTMNDDGQHCGGVSGFLLSLAAAIRQVRPTRCVVVFDGKGGSQRRRQLFPDYKQNRRTMTKLNRTYDWSSLEEEKEAMKWQLKLLVSMLDCLPLTVLHPENVEADDVLAYLAQVTVERGGKAIILSTDKDFLQLVDENITVWSPVKKKMYRPDLVTEDFGIHPNNFLMYRMVTGDSSDGIPGVEGIKEKTLLKYFPELSEARKIELNEMFDSAERQLAEKKKPPVALKTFVESRNQLELNYRLMRLDDVAMSGNTRMMVLDKFDSDPPALAKYELTKLVSQAKLMSAFGRWDEWVITTFAPLARHRSKE